MKTLEYTAGAEDTGRRIDAALAAAFPELTRSFAQQLLAEGRVLCNGRSVAKSARLTQGDALCVSLPDAQPVEIIPQDIPLDIVYEDSSLLVVNKPKGMVVHPAAGNPDGTLVNALLYHCAGRLSGINGEVRPGYMFTDTGFWDTFRSLFPLLNLIYPSMNEKMQEGLVNTYKESGFLPEWASPGHRDCMVGNNSASVVADAYIKGLQGYDIELLWEALKHGANNHLKGTASGRVAFEAYNRLGYVPNNIGVGQNVARTLEYAYNDWCIYTLGKKLGKPNSEIEIYKQRSLNYKNVYNPSEKLMVGKDDRGKFNPHFSATDWSGDFCEGNSWHWSFCVFHDPQGLIDLMGGNEAFNHMMDSVFVIPSYLGIKSRGVIHEMREMQVMNMGQYAHGNQPIQHMVYLYNYSGEPWKAQYRVRDIMEKLYSATPDGYCGDEDNGQTSAWYIFSALGFYPVCPGTDQYIIGTPLFKKAKLHLENGKCLTIEAKDNSATNKYIRSIKLNGKNHTLNYFKHNVLVEGGKIQFLMDNEPNLKRSSTKEAAPYSFSLANE